MAELWGVESAGQSAGALSERIGSKAGRTGGFVRGAEPGDDGGPAGGVEGGWSLCAVGPDISDGAAVLHAGGQRSGGAADARTSARAVRRAGVHHPGDRIGAKETLGE